MYKLTLEFERTVRHGAVINDIGFRKSYEIHRAHSNECAEHFSLSAYVLCSVVTFRRLKIQNWKGYLILILGKIRIFHLD